MICRTCPTPTLLCDKSWVAGKQMPSLLFSRVNHSMSLWDSIRRMLVCHEEMSSAPTHFIRHLPVAAFMTTSETADTAMAEHRASMQRHLRFLLWERMEVRGEIPSTAPGSAM